MTSLAPDEWITLELISAPAEEAVIDGSTLNGLHDRGLVEMSADGWTVTPLGQSILGGATLAD
ncbi:MAG: hypothetical protein DI565_03875 [Ancylobacter novellus]|uniref:Uncharacterized protein n=1 Tax=Ancylobacter novellus TaxID=921 RepID=A0A2W5MDD0_ANCNO|nr:MAG: hypothetical protein DI565_03875 [Ancylobacter novellus]